MTVESFGDDSRLIHVSRAAMATEFEVLLPASYGREETEVALEALAYVQHIERTLSIYIAQSEVSRLNRAGEEPFRASDDLFRIVETAIQISEQTRGAFDITAGPLVEAWGFTQRSGRKPDDQEIAKILQRVGYQHIEMTRKNREIRFDKPDMQINLGAIGKGFALDAVAGFLITAGIDHFLAHGGNSSVIAQGRRRADEPGWPIALSHPIRNQRKLGRIWLTEQSLSTSGSGNQFFHHQGKRLGHVLDPRTGYPAGEMFSLTYITPSAAVSDAMATAMFVNPLEDAIALVAQRADDGMVAVVPGRRDAEVEVVSTTEQWEPFQDS